MNTLPELLVQSLEKVWITFTHNWPFLLLSVLISVGLKLYMNPQKVSAFLTRYRRAGVVGATAAAVTTPFCSCGTTAVILGMMTSTIPWAPIVAFMVASPLTSPQELVLSAGLFGWPFAIAFFVSSILLGLLGGVLAEVCESRGWFANQSRFNNQPSTAAVEPVRHPALQRDLSRDIRVARPILIAAPALAQEACCAVPAAMPAAAAPATCGCSSTTESHPQAEARPSETPASTKVTVRQWVEESYKTGKQLLVMFLGFAFIGYVLNGLIPQSWVTAFFGAGNVYSVPLAATLGLPLYINTEGSLPLVRALIEGGMSQGAALAFLITGAGTSFGAATGALTIARWRVIGLVVGTLWVGSIALGFLYNLLLAAHLF